MPAGADSEAPPSWDPTNEPTTIRLRLDGYVLGDAAAREEVLADLTRLVAGLDQPATLVHAPESCRPHPLHRQGAAAELTAALSGRSHPCSSVLTIGRAATTERSSADQPPQLHEHPAHLADDAGRLTRVLALTSWPGQVEPDWLAAAAAHCSRLVLHLRPLDRAQARMVLRRRLSTLLSTAAVDEQAGRLTDPDVDLAARSAQELRDDIARGETRLVHVQCLLVVEADDLEQLDRRTDDVLDAVRSWDAEARVLRHQQAPALAAATGGTPLGGPWRLLDARSVAATLPHPVGLSSAVSGVLLGVEPSARAPVLTDRFAAHNPNRLVVGTSGAGKSYAAKLELVRWLAAGARGVVVDPEGEFERLGTTLRGLVIRVGEEPSGLDPVALACLPGLSASEGLSVLASWATALLQAPLSGVDLALLDRSLQVLRSDRRPGSRRPTAGIPELLSVAADLTLHPPWLSNHLPAALSPAATGSLAELFARSPDLDDELFPNSDDHDAVRGPVYGPRVVVFDLRAVPARARPAVMSCVLAWCWTQAVAAPPLDEHEQDAANGRRLLVVDEAHLLLDDPHAAELLAQFARRARKYSVGLEVVTQRLSDFLVHPAGQAVLANCATKLLLGCEDHERAAIRDGLGLTGPEAALLQPGRRGSGLLLAPGLRTAVQLIGHPAEHELASTGPRRR